MNEAFQSGAMTCLICIASVKRNQAVSTLQYCNLLGQNKCYCLNNVYYIIEVILGIDSFKMVKELNANLASLGFETLEDVSGYMCSLKSEYVFFFFFVMCCYHCVK